MEWILPEWDLNFLNDEWILPEWDFILPEWETT